MSRLIEADVLKKNVFDVYEYEFPTASGAFDEFVNKIIPQIINNTPTVDAAPVVHGHWIGSECSECHDDLSYYQYEMPNTVYSFCPFCGAKMDGERKDDEKP